ncbi:50S ribosomal protein L6 [bacterium (Candidatus Blackallbacteria) CG17_big_fil_post_rev_8_21_14_2_50_48_46]|uniref:Large ribosomal subunit protein uL6 n=1 Tax=bacterium (Candidatus Blackallbacteria) CG17_big_fil_post_rev_8_21_14_2_50_48_46 TaxID=2014261 RepID=A0A2M7G179_9BACT|nr:MAG: 50S ribosomal protein L6 [bacterium (Candidatus Blackallbacteria) CG18_big_fil_WC_8_21_14_2_50_49_26]PIW15406.1 MAG: 50S ribosomal protein L6 [bacterium (Candidatus Blackallbacteria) CG17_big_fil_post_rev_8_21_14_2_50_48_46]PIW49733.1 MAG: 50S ribosomal protein L6 [bacterium (Candidatus Blackallbacteria) CG13_big_fil_rev_8_21_14_2_50_49_14]
MSRIGKKPITLAKATVEVNGNVVKVKGPKGELSQELRSEVSVEVADGVLSVMRKDDSKQARALHGLYRSLLANMVEGVNNGFSKSLEMIGVGYKAALKGSNIVLNAGYSHPIEIEAPPGIVIETEGPTKIHVKGIDKELVGNIAAKIRAVRKPEPYKGKGIRYVGEVVRRKAGKSGKK